MRVIAGTARSIPLKAPKGDHTRPTQDKTKETLFNCIQFEVGGSVFVDLYSGSGAIGIESLSRGASKCYFIDNNIEAINVIKDNLKATKLESNAVVLKKNCIDAINTSIKEVADIVFLDPPYKLHAENEVLNALANSPIINSDTTIIIEANLDADILSLEKMGYEVTRLKKYKTNQHIFMKKC